MDLESTSNHSPIRPVDQLVLDLLRRKEGLTVTDLTEKLEVTATAVRQRIDRLEESGYLERRKQSAGRGRPTYSYFLTDLGWREVGVTYTDLAIALWGEVLAFEDETLRNGLIQRVSKRMGRVFRELLPEGTLEDRMKSLANLMANRRIPTSFDNASGLPVLEVHACPYPDLTGGHHDRNLCHLEQQVLSEAIGQPLELSMCKLDGHGCCQFKPVPSNTTEPVSIPEAQPIG
ncbi:MAG: MarR family transcriptional regulator [Planctomycetes bacterium]|nr:MarR family transcriptional regulator [Planctomycetota bacterium]